MDNTHLLWKGTKQEFDYRSYKPKHTPSPKRLKLNQLATPFRPRRDKIYKA